MIYLDTDVWVHAYAVQDEQKHRQANEIIERAYGSSGLVISNLCIQEMLFVLNRERFERGEIFAAYESLMRFRPVAYSMEDLRRAVEIARSVGFRRINDCIHTAVAEAHCTELITYNGQDLNGQDLNRIRNFARIAITVL